MTGIWRLARGVWARWRGGASSLAEARELLERMGAAVWLGRLDAIAPAAAMSV